MMLQSDVKHTISLWLDFGCEALPVTFEDEILLGRKNITEQRVLDLSAFDAYALGVSRIHAALSVSGDRLFLEDRGSDEGTWLGDQLCMPFKRYEVLPGDMIRLGRLEFRLGAG